MKSKKMKKNEKKMNKKIVNKNIKKMKKKKKKKKKKMRITVCGHQQFQAAAKRQIIMTMKMDNTSQKRRQALNNSENMLEIQSLTKNLKLMKSNQINLIDLKIKVKKFRKVKSIFLKKNRKKKKLNSMSSQANLNKHAHWLC